MGQPVSRETVTSEARVQSGANICETFRADRDNLTGFSPSASVYVICISPANVLHSLTCHRCSATDSVINTILKKVSHVLQSNRTLKLGGYKILGTLFSNLLLIAKFDTNNH
jgi:hypothetical protein